MAKVIKPKEAAKAGQPEVETMQELPDNQGIDRRLLQFVNAARLPEDFLKPPQRVRDTTGEHGREEGMMHAGEHHGKDPWEQAKLDRDLAIEIIRRRPPFGYFDIQQLTDLDQLRIPLWLEDLLRYLRATRFGSWSTGWNDACSRQSAWMRCARR